MDIAWLKANSEGWDYDIADLWLEDWERTDRDDDILTAVADSIGAKWDIDNADESPLTKYVKSLNL